MKRILKALGECLLVTAVIFAWCNKAQASFSFGTAGEQVGDWSQQWLENGVGNFTQLELIMQTPGVTFASPALGNFSVSGWANVPYSSTLAVAVGPATTSLTFYNYVATPKSTPFTMNMYAWYQGNAVDALQANWSGSAWSYATLPLASAPAPVPEASTMIAGMLLLLPLGASGLRILRKNRTA